ncbi:cell division suppressor protein YneA [Tuberibacillus sp. Marseille-P3662]|uniref:cell division suppressor protein YneA n=1 Tax=Tuberibacillus sp. Marseille-P3662 TaxID=1965358 RepID=UPI000A1CD6B7|nr:LysM peptidoglycan-binding domain-containing protein [Tuberibacillus sp. Marseille-P3662]
MTVIKRVTKTYCLYFIFGILVILSIFEVADQLHPAQAGQFKTIEVEAGDTLWEIGEDFQDQHHMPIKKFVNWVERVNHINAYQLDIGETLVIPIEK